MKRRIAVLLMLGMMPWAGLHAQSQTVSGTFRVSARVEAVCEVTASAPLRGTTLLRATCTPGSTHNVGLNTKTVWGIGTGLAQDYTVFGGVPAAQLVRAGDYTDTITVRVYY